MLRLMQIDDNVSYTIKCFITSSNIEDNKAEGGRRTKESEPGEAPGNPAAGKKISISLTRKS